MPTSMGSRAALMLRVRGRGMLISSPHRSPPARIRPPAVRTRGRRASNLATAAGGAGACVTTRAHACTSGAPRLARITSCGR